jgi:hemerythrin superfamily protein
MSNNYLYFHEFYEDFKNHKHKVEKVVYPFVKTLYMCCLCKKYIPESNVRILYLSKGSIEEIKSIESI